MTKRITLLASHGVQPLDVTGPASVFAQANECMGDDTYYSVELVSPEGGQISAFAEVGLMTQSIEETDTSGIHTLLIAGHKPKGTAELVTNLAAQAWFSEAAKTAMRWGSVCGGTYILAHWGLISGCRVATHWRTVDRLAREFKDICVDGDALYVTNDKLWTSAGVTAGIDMALAMVEADVGPDIAAQVARHLVVYMRRPASQSQFSEPLRHQSHAASPYEPLINWMKSNLHSDLSVDRLAERAGQSVRTFQRKFADDIGRTPAAFVEDLRLERAKALLSSNVPIKTIAQNVGYVSPAQLNLVFQRRFRLAPSMWKAMHADAE